MLGGVAVARDDLILDVLVLLVLDLQRLVVRPHQLHFQLAIGAVLLGVGGLVGDGVLIADGLRDLAEDFRQLALKRGVYQCPPVSLAKVFIWLSA